LTLQEDERATGPAEASFRQALEIARRQGAKSLELRAAVSLGRLWAGKENVKDAYTLLSGVYAFFTEGFETADVREAKSLLDELERRAGGSRTGRRARPPACS